jgi:hypothetical protein
MLLGFLQETMSLPNLNSGITYEDNSKQKVLRVKFYQLIKYSKEDLIMSKHLE